MKRISREATVFALAGLLGAAAACSSSSDTANPGGDGGPTGSGGATGNGGGASDGGKGTAGTGGKSNSGGTGGRQPGTGGANAGKGGGAAGMASKGGSGNGGATNGGTNNGGSSSGGSSSGGANAGGTSGAGGGSSAGGAPPGGAAGWLYTKGNKIYVTGDDANPWVGRGVNIDDIFFCGYNNTLWMQNAGDTFKQMVSGLMAGWKPTFLRVSLGMASYTSSTSWLTNPAQYKNPMVDAIKNIGTYPKTYVLVTLRSDKSMILQDQQHGDPEATGIPSDATTSPDKTAFPTGTDAVYKALVNDFKDSPFVLFGITNEAGGNLQSDATIAAAMTHAVSTIRDEEDRIGAHHHVIAVQGNNWTSSIGFYASKPIAKDNVIYEVHGYPPPADTYTYDNLPVIIGEYGSLSGDSASFFNDLESKKIPSLAWDFQPFSGCAPDLVDVTRDATKLTPNAWGKVVQTYLLAHAK
jgi:hypothetical protein